MEPLKLSALPGVEEWDTFKLEMKGFISPQKMDRWPDCDTIQDHLRYFTSSDFMRDNDAPFLASSISKAFPATRLTICEENFTVPVSSRDMTFLATHLGNSASHQGPHFNLNFCIFSVPDCGQVSILSDAAKNLLWSTNRAVLHKLKAFEGNGGHEIILVGLEVLKAGSHCLQSTATAENHYATIFLVLPTFTDSVDISVRATHDSVVNQMKFPENLSQTACAVGMYTNVSDAHIQDSVIPTLQGALPPLRDAFCLWRHMLNCAGEKTPQLTLLFLVGHPNSAKDLKGEDATLLCYLAPLAKAYGFKMYIARLHLEMPDDADVKYQWKELRSLGGVPVKSQDLLELADKLLNTDEYLNDQLSEVDVEEDHEFLDDTCYYSTVKYTHTKEVSVLLIAP
ncbi:hypothetical protein C8R45DRAFT_1211736 [Mycena sanguinolenta]|nr:hypothetical protein C8R45DRAFT_1211736 [Mycena sanguinolenta]